MLFLLGNYTVCSDWLISNLCPRSEPDYTISGFAPFKSGYSEYPLLTLTLYHIEVYYLTLAGYTIV